MSDNLRDKTLSGFIYKTLERIGAQGVHLLVSIVLARIILPEHYGLISLVTVIITILDVFVTYGFGNSLIAKKESDNIDFSTCFWFGLFLSLVIYGLVFLCAPSIERFYSYNGIAIVLRIMALRIPIAAVNSIQQAYVSKHMMFKKFFISTSIGTVISGVIAIVMAYKGFGIWALVEQYLGNIIIDTICLSFIVNWHPSFVFSFDRLRYIYSYGWKILVVGLIDTGYSQLRSLVIGKEYSSADLAYYNKGNQFPSLATGIIEPTINGVLFPALAKCSDDQQMMKNVTRRTIKSATYIIFPVMIGLLVTAKPLIQIILTDKWLPSVVFLQICCFAQMFRPIQFINNCVVKASGQSGLLLKLDIIKKVIGVLLLIVSVRWGVVAIAISMAITNIIATVINIIPNRRILSYGYIAQFSDTGINLMLSVIMGIVVYFISFLGLTPVFQLFIQIAVGVFVYVGLSILLKNDSFTYISYLLKKKIFARR